MLSDYFHTYYMQIIIGTASFFYLDPFMKALTLIIVLLHCDLLYLVQSDLTRVSLYDTICYKYNYP